MATRIGCDGLVYAIMTTEETPTTAPVYGAPVTAPGVMHININPNASLDTLFADDGPMESATTLGKIEVEIEKNALSTPDKAALLGHKIDADGGLAYGDTDTPPFVAIGFRSMKSNGTYRYVWLYKGKFTDPEDKYETKADSVKFQSDTIKGQFVKLNKLYSVGGSSVRPWKYEIDGDYAGVNQTAITNFFTQVNLPNASATTAAPLLTVAVAQGTVSGSTKATITGTSANHWGYVISTQTPAQPAIGAPIYNAVTYTSAADIPGILAGQTLTIYDLSAANLVQKYYTQVVLAAAIKP